LYDLTGYWISVVTEDWRFRMVTPPKGDYTGVVLNEQGRKIAVGDGGNIAVQVGQQARPGTILAWKEEMKEMRAIPVLTRWRRLFAELYFLSLRERQANRTRPKPASA
jgi:hypothetical protein